MRDHPAHHTPYLGGTWAARLDQPNINIRKMWENGWENILRKVFKKKIKSVKIQLGPVALVTDHHL